ncbi:MAG: hypothetical protein C5B56_04560 [Proteobacteria bacterium]|nr:MAG: hypothetical protein C5B56_04560 [Pseudomonadota bacterium]
MKGFILMTLVCLAQICGHAQGFMPPGATTFVASLRGGGELPPCPSLGVGAARIWYGSAPSPGHPPPTNIPPLTVSVVLPFGFYPTDGAIYGPAVPGEDGPLLYDLGQPAFWTNIFCVETWGNPPICSTNVWWGYQSTFNVTSNELNDLSAGLWYINVTSSNYPQGEIRGQVLRSGVSRSIRLDGSVSFPGLPVGGSTNGWLSISNAGNSALTITGIIYPTNFTGSNWTGAISPENSILLPVTFSPTTQQFYRGEILVGSDAFDGEYTLPVSGAGFSPLTDTSNWMIWWQRSDSTLGVWNMQGEARAYATRISPASPGPGWRAVAAADLDGDGWDDLVFEHTNGSLGVWFMASYDYRQSYPAPLSPARVDPKWHLMAAADLNGDGQPDLLWQDSDGSVAVWLMNGLAATQTVRLTSTPVDRSWRIVGSGDFNGDGHTDILWQHSDGRVAIWLMNGTSRTAVAYLSPSQADPDWKIYSAVDFNRDGHPGLVWQHTSGAIAYWEMAGTNCVHTGRISPGMADPQWRIVGPR